MAEKGRRQKILVAAIDFGTTFSGFAYQFKTTFDQEPTKIFANTKWERDEQLSHKTVTAILFDGNRKFHSFGYVAENEYSKLVLRKEHMNWLFFKHFKMELHDKKITRDIKIKARNGKEVKAMEVFGASIKYMKDLLLKQLSNADTLVTDDQIHWVVTVPAIWSDSAKQFMRESSYKAGIKSEQLTIALEPEAASFYCQLVTEVQVTRNQTTTDMTISSKGQKFMVIDLGGMEKKMLQASVNPHCGGTADISVHMRQKDGKIAEIHPPTGGYYGGTQIDQAFEDLLIGLIGNPVYKKFCDNNPIDYLQLMTAFERSKRTYNTQNAEIMITIPINIRKYYEEDTSDTIEQAITRSPYNKKIEVIGDKLILKASIMKTMFSRCANKLVNHVEELLRLNEVKGTDIILMVGGFSEAAYMQNEIKNKFPNTKVIIPEDAGLAVLKGAVLYGHNTTSISSRMAKHTYGINTLPLFDPDRHPKTHRVDIEHVARCRDVFMIYIHKGELIPNGQATCAIHTPLNAKQEYMVLNVYTSNRKHPKFVDDDGCENIGELIVKLPKKTEAVEVKVRMMFGDTEVTVEAEELATNKMYTAYFDFL